MNLLPKSKFSSVFGDIEPLYNLNRTLYEEILSQDNQGNVGNAFLKIAPYLKLYSTYAHDYEIALKLLQVCLVFTNDLTAYKPTVLNRTCGKTTKSLKHLSASRKDFLRYQEN